MGKTDFFLAMYHYLIEGEPPRGRVHMRIPKRAGGYSLVISVISLKLKKMGKVLKNTQNIFCIPKWK